MRENNFNLNLQSQIAKVLTVLFLTTAINVKDVNATELSKVDSVAVIVTPIGADNTSIPILSSDIELVARLLLVQKFKTEWKNQKITSVLLVKAKRVAAISRLLAHASSMLGEKIKPSKRQEMIEQFTVYSGGVDGVNRILLETGVSKFDFEFWINTFMLASIHLQYLVEQQKITGLKNTGFKENTDGDSTLVTKLGKEAEDVLVKWLSNSFENGKIIFLK